jgi:hypothetical protein
MDGQQPNQQPSTPHDDQRPADDYQAASQATAAYDTYTKQGSAYTAPRHRVRKLLIILASLLLLGAIGFGVYWLFLRDKDNTSAPANTSQNESDDQTDETDKTARISTKTEHHVSALFMLEFDYPEDWTVAEETGSGYLTVQSPALQLMPAAGSTTTGRAVFKIRNKQQPLPEFDAGNAVAVRESEKIDYTKPSSVQRGSTYLSFLQYANSADGIDGIYITGDTGYQAAQAIPKADFTPVDPVISLTFEKCADSTCTGEGTPMGIAETMWQNTAFATPLKAIFQSLIIN